MGYAINKVWKRKESDKWYFFNGILVCSEHEGAEEYFNAALKLSIQRAKILGE